MSVLRSLNCRSHGPVLRETFAPILYVIKYRDFDEALDLHNAVPKACRPPSSPTICARPSIPVRARHRLRHRQRQHRPVGAEIGGAFGGEKETGGGRESGSDAWKAYMRRATNTVNYGRTCRWRRA